MCEALEIGKRFSAFKRKKAGVSSVGSKGSSDIGRLRRQAGRGSIMHGLDAMLTTLHFILMPR